MTGLSGNFHTCMFVYLYASVAVGWSEGLRPYANSQVPGKEPALWKQAEEIGEHFHQGSLRIVGQVASSLSFSFVA